MDWERIIPERYRVKYDNGIWFILDTWHPQVKNIADLDQDISVDSPAIKKISELEINAIVGEMIKMGWLDKFKHSDEQMEISNITKKKEDIRQIAIENITLVVQNEADSSIAREAIIAIREIVNKDV